MKPNQQSEFLLTRRQVCQQLQLHRDTVRTWERAGLLKSVTLPTGRLRYRPSEVARILANYNPHRPSKPGPKPKAPLGRV